MTKIKNLSDKELNAMLKSIEVESKMRANRKSAAKAILVILKKHGLSVADLPDLDFGAKRGRRPTNGRKSGRPAGRKSEGKAPRKSANQTDKRSQVVAKFKNPNGREKWTGRGRAPRWVQEVLKARNIDLSQFKSDATYQL